MPVSFRVGKSKLLNESFFSFEIFGHLLNRNIIITDGRCLPISLDTKMIKFDYKCRLMGFCSFGNSERMFEREVVYFVRDFQLVNFKG